MNRDSLWTGRWQLNWRFLLISGALFAVVGAALWATHRWQRVRIAEALLQRAADQQQEGHWTDAAQTLHRFLSLRPDHAEARALLAQCFDKTAKTPAAQRRAIEFYYRAIGADPDKLQLRRRQGELLFEVAEYATAIEQARAILAADPRAADAQRLLALAGYGRLLQQRLPLSAEVKADFESALAAIPSDAYLANVAAHALRDRFGRTKDSKDSADADDIMDRLVAAAPRDPAAWLARHGYRIRHQLPGAEDDLQRARTLAAGNSQVLYAVAEDALRRQDWSTAKQACHRLADAGEKNPVLYRLWGDAALGGGDKDAALAHWEAGIRLPAGDSRDLQLRLATVYVARGNHQAAAPLLTALEEATSLAPTSGGQLARIRIQNKIKMLRAQWHLAQQQWSQATPLLKAVGLSFGQGTQNADDRRLAAEAWHILAQRETQLERFDLAATHWEHALSIEPASVSIRLALVRTLAAAGQLASAQKHAQIAVMRGPENGEAQLAAAELQLAMEARASAGERDPARAEAYVAAAERLLPGDHRPTLLRTSLDFLAGRVKDRSDAVHRLKLLADRFPDAASLQARLILWCQRLGDSAGADAALARLQNIAPEATDTQVRKAEMLIERKQFEDVRPLLLGLEDRSSLHERHQLARLWLRLETLAGEPAAANRAWQRLATAFPDDPYPVLLLAEAALREGNLSVAQRWEQQLAAIEGDDGASWRYLRARRLLANKDATKQLELNRLAQWLMVRRTGWPQTWILAGMMAEHTQSWDRAIEAYQQAVTLDATRVNVHQRLLQLLYQQGRYSEVDRFVAVLAARGPLSADASLVAIGSAAAQNELSEALELAQAAAKANPENVAAALWFAHLNLVLDDAAQAETTLDSLLARFGNDPRVWGGKLSFYQARRDRAGFTRTLQQCEAITGLAAPAKALLLAQGYELLGQPERAAGYYVQAIAAGQRDAALRLRLAAVQLQFDPQLAETTLRAIRAEFPSSIGARRMLAVTLAARRKPEVWPEIQELLSTSPPAEQAEDARLAAVLRLQDASAGEIAQARALLEKVIASATSPQPQDRLLLAMLYEQEGNIAAARAEYLRVVESTMAGAEQLQAWVAFCIRQSDAEAALPFIDRMEQLKANPRIVQQWRAVALQAAKRDTELAALLAEVENEPLPGLEKPEERSAHRMHLVNLYEALKLSAEAERHLRAMVSEQPAAMPTLVVWLLNRQRTPEALELALETCRGKTTAENVTLLANALAVEGGGAEAHAAADEFLTALGQKSPDAAVLASIGNLRISQQRLDDAVALLRRATELAPDDYLSLNNLAALLADREGAGDSALECIDRAIAHAPRPQPFLLDTRAKILLHQHKTADALAQLEEIIKRWPQAESRIYFHLALAYDRSGRSEDARLALATARQRGLELRQLTPGDRELCQALDRKFASVLSRDGVGGAATVSP